MKKVLSIFALALALVACTDKPQWEPATPSQPLTTSLTLDTAKSFDSNSLNRATIYHINGSVIKLSLSDATDYDVVDYSKAHNADLQVVISAAQLGSSDAKDRVLPCEILCVGKVNSIADIDLSLATTTNADFEESAEEATPATAEAGEPAETPAEEPVKLQWGTTAVLPTLSTVAEEKAAETDPNVYKAATKYGYIVRRSVENLNDDGTTSLEVYETYAVVVTSYSITEAYAETEVLLPNYGVTTVFPEYSYSCVAGIEYKKF